MNTAAIKHLKRPKFQHNMRMESLNEKQKI